MSNAIPMLTYIRVASTQAIAKRCPRNRIIHQAWEQKVGYGRNGSRWISPDNCGLYMSIALEGEYEPKPFMRSVSQMVAHQVQTETTRKTTYVGNDIYVRGKKVAGVIAEVVNREGTPRTIIGIGINIKPHKTTLEYEHLCENTAPDSVVSQLVYDLAQGIARDILLTYK